MCQMSGQREILPGDILHVFNRGVDKRMIFMDRPRDYRRFLECIRFCNLYAYPYSRHKQQLDQTHSGKTQTDFLSLLNTLYKYPQPLCSIIAYALMPNHFHLLLKEKAAGGVTKYMQKLSNAYTKYFNRKNNRSGSLFQGRYKSVHVQNEQQLLQVFRYIHLNPVAGSLIDPKDLQDYPWTSLREYRDANSAKPICDTNVIASCFNTKNDFDGFITEEYSLSNIQRLDPKLLIDDDFDWH